jgi:UDP-glucuronate decarboxylase
MDEIERLVFNLGKRMQQEFEDKTVLVTGGAGFLGSWICDVLVNANAFVICIDNFPSGSKSNISHLSTRENFRFFHIDIGSGIFLQQQDRFRVSSRRHDIGFRHQ